MKPSLFYGTAVSAVIGLALGLGLHSEWQSHEGGPQVLVASAAAAELARVRDGNDIIETSETADTTSGFADISWLDTGQGPADSLPVVRLTRMGGAPRPAATEVERVDADTASKETTSVTTVGDFKDDAPSGPRIPAGSYVPASYTPGDAAF